MPKQYGHNRDWNVDLIPKFIMADGKLVKMLLHTKVTKYLEWKCVEASFVCQMQAAGWLSSAKMAVCKVPVTPQEALKSNLLGLFEKKRVAQMFQYVRSVDVNDSKTWDKVDLKT